jgi:hypothetical protein
VSFWQELEDRLVPLADACQTGAQRGVECVLGLLGKVRYLHLAGGDDRGLGSAGGWHAPGQRPGGRCGVNIRERAEAALKRAQAATPGPWHDEDKNFVYSRHSDENVAECWDKNGHDAAFIAAAREDVPALAEEVLRLTGDEMRERIRQTIGCEIPLARPSHVKDAADAIMALLRGAA